MSWKASAWAKEQRLGSPAAKSILLCLADYADPEKAECWPGTEQLAADAEVSERTARDWLGRLEAWGLLERIRRNRPSGARASDIIALKLDVRVTDGAERCREPAPEVDCAENLPENSAGRTYRQPDAEPTGNGQQPTGNQRRAYKEEPSIEPSNGTSQQARESARERDLDRNSRNRIDAAFWRTIKGWPGFDGMPKEPARRAWMKLTDEEREAAEARAADWRAMLKAQGWKNTPAPATYFGEKLWLAVPDAPPPPPADIDAPPFGPLWGAIWQAELFTPPQPSPPPPPGLADLVAQDTQAGRNERMRRQALYGWPQLKGMAEAAERRRGRRVAAGSSIVRMTPLMEPVPVDSATFDAWRAEYERRGWPWLPDPGGQRVVYFPAGGPDGLQAFERAVRGDGDDAGRSEAAE